MKPTSLMISVSMTCLLLAASSSRANEVARCVFSKTLRLQVSTAMAGAYLSAIGPQADRAAYEECLAYAGQNCLFNSGSPSVPRNLGNGFSEVSASYTYVNDIPECQSEIAALSPSTNSGSSDPMGGSTPTTPVASSAKDPMDPAARSPQPTEPRPVIDPMGGTSKNRQTDRRIEIPVKYQD